MKEVKKQVTINLEAYDSETGESHTFEATETIKEEYYSIRKITTRINNMDFLGTLEVVCKSSKDINIVNNLLELHDNNNYIRLSNISDYARNIECSRQKLTDILKRMQNSNLIYKTDRGIYMINPYIWIGRRIRSNKLREEAQLQWTKIIDDI